MSDISKDTLERIKVKIKAKSDAFAKEFGFVFWYKNAFCKRRQQEHKGVPCDNCESRAMCCIYNKLLEQEVEIHNDNIVIQSGNIYITKLEEVNSELRNNYVILKQIVERIQDDNKNKKLATMEGSRKET